MLKGNLESVTSELDEQVVMKYQREVVTIQNMREDYQILRNQFFYLEPADVDSFEKYLQCGRHTEKLAYELDIKPEALKMQMCRIKKVVFEQTSSILIRKYQHL